MATALIQQLREAVVTILGANATVATLCGGTARVVDRGTTGPVPALPAVAYEIARLNPATGDAAVRLTGLSVDADNAQAEAWELVDAARQALTQTTFAAQGLQVAVLEGAPEDVAEVGLLDLGHPTLRQADWSLPLLVLD